jgi:predicted nucleotidyltransferase
MKNKKYPEKQTSGGKVSEPTASVYGIAEDLRVPEFLKPFMKEIDNLCKKNHVARLYVFGSVLREDFSTDSDLDFIVKIREVSIKIYTDSFFEIYEGLQKILKRKVDLITEPSMTNPYFLEGINRTKTLIYSE